MRFESPLALLSLVLLPAIVGGYLLARRRRPRYAVSFTNLDVLRQVAGPFAARRELAIATLALASLALCLVAVARPQVSRVVAVENATVVLVVDTSRSMLSNDVAPTRLAAAKQAAHSFLDRVPDRLRIGLVTFAGDVTVAAFPTHDREQVRSSVAGITRWNAGGGTAIGDALVRAVELADDAFGEGGRPHSGCRRARPREPGHDPLPIGRAPEPRPDPGRSGRSGRQAGGDPRVHRRARDRQARPGRRGSRGVRLRRRLQPRPGPRDAEEDRHDDRAVSTSRHAPPKPSPPHTTTSARASAAPSARRKSRSCSSPQPGSRSSGRPGWRASGRPGFPEPLLSAQPEARRDARVGVVLLVRLGDSFRVVRRRRVAPPHARERTRRRLPRRQRRDRERPDTRNGHE